MHQYAQKAGMQEPYIIDKNMQIADVFGVQRLPEVFIFNSKGFLTYRGAIKTVPANGKVNVCFACEAVQNIDNIGAVKLFCYSRCRLCGYTPAHGIKFCR